MTLSDSHSEGLGAAEPLKFANENLQWSLNMHEHTF